MRKVCVVGGGAAGAAAARGAADFGAHVTLFDTGEPGPSSLGLALTESQESSTRFEHQAGTQVVSGERVSSVSELKRVSTPKRKLQFDSVVVASGTSPRPCIIPGHSKKGVFVLDTWGAYARLREALPELSKVVVTGPPLAALSTAARLSESGPQVTLMAGRTSLRTALQDAVLERVISSASSTGVEVRETSPERMLGIDGVEAVLSEGRVVSCDGVVVVPEGIPRIPELGVRKGVGGGIMVDDRLESSIHGVFAAGGCAERGASSEASRFGAGVAEGRVAGANAAGGLHTSRPVGCVELRLFGGELLAVGSSLAEAHSPGILSKCSWADSKRTCSLTFEKKTGRVLGVQAFGEGALSMSGFIYFAVSRGATLKELAYIGSPGSIDITPTAEAAREEIRARQRS